MLSERVVSADNVMPYTCLNKITASCVDILSTTTTDTCGQFEGCCWNYLVTQVTCDTGPVNWCTAAGRDSYSTKSCTCYGSDSPGIVTTITRDQEMPTSSRPGVTRSATNSQDSGTQNK